jgi:cyclopropane-fatty-acyl-phospholipid synthase
MNPQPTSRSSTWSDAPAASTRASPTRSQRSLLAVLKNLSHGCLELQTPDGQRLQFVGKQAPQAASAAIAVHDPAVFARLLKHGDIGLAETYLDGAWTSPDLPALLRLGLLNRESLERVIYGSALGALVYRLTHRLRRNTRAGSRRNIHAHYDLGNAFYALWLDPSMNYSSAWFGGNHAQPLQQAQEAKMARALAEVGAGENSRVLEIGCGWGAVAELAAQHGAHLTGVTLSTEQLDYAKNRLSKAGLAARTDLRLQDYRDLPTANDQAFDAIVSIEMFEAVGREYWASYFDTIKRCLAPEGRACIQTITVRDELFERYVRSTDFIQQYVFPGGLLPSPSVFRAQAQKAGLVVTNELAFGTDYAQTLRLWRQAFMAQLPQVRAQGFDSRFIRLWEFYLAYCEAAFDTANTDVMQFTLRHAPRHAPNHAR